MIPQELTTLPQWVVAGSNKVPLNPRTLRTASTTDSRTWATYEDAVTVAEKNSLYVGFVFTEDDPYVGIDLDEPVDDEQLERHKRILENIVTYTELSVSGKGVHLIAKGSIPHALKRDKVEVYSKERYFIVTGKLVNGRPHEINDCTEIIAQLVEEMGKSNQRTIEHSEPEREDDEAVYERCRNSANGDAFEMLWRGAWQTAYGSQSEADYALVNLLAFASPNNDQVKRLFRQSILGSRKKATREDYLDTMIGSIRAEQHPPVDFTQFTPPEPSNPAPNFQAQQPTNTDTNYPRGLVGEMARYIYDTATRPVPQVALAGSLALMAGMTGRSYTISNTGLNIYLMLVAGTAIGKEGATQGIDRIVESVAHTLPSITQFVGATEYASGQALIKELSQRACFVSVLDEFGHTLRKVCNPNAIGSDVMWRKLLLSLYNKSGPTDRLGTMVYSDTGKNTPVVPSPAFSLLTESSPSSLYEGLDEQAIEIGLVPRFILLECGNYRPPGNEHAFAPPSKELTKRVEALAQRSLSMQANNSRVTIQMNAGAQKLMKDFDREVDEHINAGTEDSIRQIWSRAHLKALRIAGLVSVGLNYDDPTVDEYAAQWAIDLIRVDAKNMLRRFGEGVGVGDPVQLARLRHVIMNVLRNSSSRLMKEHNVVEHRPISQRCYALACYRQDRRGAGAALDRALQALKDGGEIIELSAKDRMDYFKTVAKCYAVTKNFQWEDEK